MNLINRVLITGNRFILYCCIFLLLSACQSVEVKKNDEVYLHYNFKEGQAINTRTRIKAEVDISGFFSRSKTIKMLMDVLVTIKKIRDNGEIDAIYQITRVKAKEGRRVFDTAVPATLKNERTKILFDLLEIKFFVTMNKDGKIKNFDMSGYYALLKKHDLSDRMQLKNNLDKLLNNSFVCLPDGPVKAGDFFPETMINQDLPNIGRLNMYVKYLIDNISDNKRFVYLKPQVRVEVLNRNSERRLDLKDADFTGEIVFDREKGIITRTRMFQKLEMALYQGRMRIGMGMKTWVVFEVIDNESAKKEKRDVKKSKEQFLAWFKKGAVIFSKTDDSLSEASGEKDIIKILDIFSYNLAIHVKEGQAYKENIRNVDFRNPGKEIKNIFDEYDRAYRNIRKNEKKIIGLYGPNKGIKNAFKNLNKSINDLGSLLDSSRYNYKRTDEWSDMN